MFTLFIISFSSLFWATILKDIVIHGFESHQNNYFSNKLLLAPIIYLFSISLIGSIVFCGFIFILRSYKKSGDYKVLGNTLFAIFFIYLIGFIGILSEFPIMHLRFASVIKYVLIISFSISYGKIIHFIKQNKILKKNKITTNIYQIEIYVLIFITSFQHYNVIRGTYDSVPYEQAYDEDVRYDLIDVIEELDYEDKVFLTNNYKVVAYLPIYLFLLPNPYFSHPSALYNKRLRFLNELSECESSKEFHDKIIDNEFGPIDFFWLDKNDNSSAYVFKAPIEDFPEGRTYYYIIFKNELFNNPKCFEKIEIDGEIIYETI